LGLIKKALYIWIVQYHFVIPRKILSGYIHKYRTESENIAKYGKRFYDPEDAGEYNQWLSFQTYQSISMPVSISFIGKNLSALTNLSFPKQAMDHLDLSHIVTEYVCIVGDGCYFYDVFEQYLGECTKYDIVYFDHDEINAAGNRSHPMLKPDFSYDTLRGYNYIGHCWIVKTSQLKQFDGQNWCPYRWLLELSDQKLAWGHIEKVLYGDSELLQSEMTVLQQYVTDHDIPAEIQQMSDGVSTLVNYKLARKPLISIVIPTKDGVDVLDVCLKSIIAKSTYDHYEIVIADNGSILPETQKYFQKIQQEHDNIHVFSCPGPFNFSAINNQAVFDHANGEYVVLLNNDTSIITEDWLEKMVSYAQQKHVGSVGTLMYYPDGSIQHAGVITGKGGGFAHRYYRKPGNTKDYMYSLTVPNDVAGCTAACLMLSKQKYQEVHGMNEELAVQFNDVDLEIKLLEKGYFNVFLPNVKLTHYESKSRGIDKDKTAVERYVNEVEYAQIHYAKWIEHDPYYNDQFDKNYDYMLIVGKGSN